jgi:hypothetical protein
VFVKPVKVEESLGEGKLTIAPTRQGKKGKKNSIVSHASYPEPRVVHPPMKNYLLKGLSLHAVIVEKWGFGHDDERSAI